MIDTYGNEISQADCPEDFIDGVVRWETTVEDVEVTFQPLWDIIPTTTRVDHGAHHLNIYDVCKLSGLLQIIETLHLNHLTGDLVSYLNTRNKYFIT